MQKKKFDLTADLIDISDEDKRKVQPSQNIVRTVLKKEKETILLTVSVKESFRAEFKSWCARHRLKMNEAVIEGFQLLKEKNGP